MWISIYVRILTVLYISRTCMTILKLQCITTPGISKYHNVSKYCISYNILKDLIIVWHNKPIIKSEIHYDWESVKNDVDSRRTTMK